MGPERKARVGGKMRSNIGRGLRRRRGYSEMPYSKRSVAVAGLRWAAVKVDASAEKSRSPVPSTWARLTMARPQLRSVREAGWVMVVRCQHHDHPWISDERGTGGDGMGWDGGMHRAKLAEGRSHARWSR